MSPLSHYSTTAPFIYVHLCILGSLYINRFPSVFFLKFFFHSYPSPYLLLYHGHPFPVPWKSSSSIISCSNTCPYTHTHTGSTAWIKGRVRGDGMEVDWNKTCLLHIWVSQAINISVFEKKQKQKSSSFALYTYLQTQMALLTAFFPRSVPRACTTSTLTHRGSASTPRRKDPIVSIYWNNLFSTRILSLIKENQWKMNNKQD